MALRNVRGPRGVSLVTLGDIGLEVNRSPQTLKSLAEKLRFPLVKVKTKATRNGKRKTETLCIEPRNVPALMRKASDLRRYTPGTRHSGGVIGDRTNGASPVAPPETRPFFPKIESISREALAAAIKPFIDAGLSKLTFDSGTGEVSYAVQQAASFRI